MPSLRDAFDDEDEPLPPAILIRPMEARDTWEMVQLERRNAGRYMSGEEQMALKRLYDTMIPHALVAIKRGSGLVGFGIAPAAPGLFTQPRGILKLVSKPDPVPAEEPGRDGDQTDCIRRLIRGFALQAMADGRNGLEICVADGDEMTENACADYLAHAAGRLNRDTPLGPISGQVFRIEPLTAHFGFGVAPKLPRPRP